MRKYLVFFLGLFSVNTFANPNLANDTIVDGKTIQEVVVQGREIIVKEDKMIINVSSKVKKYSHDGYSALSMLLIPGLKVNAFDESVSANGASTLLCINGRSVDKDEVKTLNPKDIKRIDYYPQFHPEYPGVQGGVIDFIVRIRENGGMLMAQANQNLNMVSGNDMVDWKFFQKKSEFGILIIDNYRHYTPSHGQEEVTSMAFNSGDMIKNTVTLPSAMHTNGIKGQLSFLHRFENGTLKIAASLRSGHDAHSKMMRQFFQNSNVDGKEASDFTHTDNMSPTFKIEYRLLFKNKATLRIGLSGDYTSTERDREYSSMQTYQSKTKEKFLHLTPSILMAYPINKRNTSFLSAAYYYDKATTDYWENDVYSPSKLTDGQAHIVLGHTCRLIPNRLNFTLQLEERVMTVDDGTNQITRGFFTPCLFYTVTLPHGNTFRGDFGWGAFTPQMKYYTATEKRVDEYQVIVGNPNQKTDYGFGGKLTFSSVHKWGAVNVIATYDSNERPLYENITCDNDRNVYVHSFLNGGRYERCLFNSSVQWNIIPKTLSIEAGGEYVYSKGHFPTKQTRSTFYPVVELKYLNKGLQCNLTFAGKQKIMDQGGYRTDKPVTFKLAVGYTINNLFLNIYANNPFMKTPVKMSFATDGYSNIATNYSPRIDYNMIAMRVSYRFTYGKKHKFENTNLEDANRSAILDAGTK